jgi:hypothetical protein
MHDDRPALRRAPPGGGIRQGQGSPSPPRDRATRDALRPAGRRAHGISWPRSVAPRPAVVSLLFRKLLSSSGRCPEMPRPIRAVCDGRRKISERTRPVSMPGACRIARMTLGAAGSVPCTAEPVAPRVAGLAARLALHAPMRLERHPRRVTPRSRGRLRLRLRHRHMGARSHGSRCHHHVPALRTFSGGGDRTTARHADLQVPVLPHPAARTPHRLLRRLRVRRSGLRTCRREPRDPRRLSQAPASTARRNFRPDGVF